MLKSDILRQAAERFGWPVQEIKLMTTKYGFECTYNDLKVGDIVQSPGMPVDAPFNTCRVAEVILPPYGKAILHRAYINSFNGNPSFEVVDLLLPSNQTIWVYQGERTPKYNRHKAALDLQDACNMRAIAREFVKICDDAHEELQDTGKVWRDAAVSIVVDKLMSLSLIKTNSFDLAYQVCKEKATEERYE